MKPQLSIKTLFRTPFKTLLTFLLLAAVTFTLFSRIAEYTILDREIDNAANSYKGVGAAEVTPAPDSYPELPFQFYILADSRVIQDFPEEEQEYYLNNLRYQPLTQQQVQAILKLPFIEKTSVRYMTAGVSDQYNRLEEGSDWYIYNEPVVIESTISDIKYNRAYNSDYIETIRLILDDYKLLAGDPSYISAGQISINAVIFSVTHFDYNAEIGPGGALGYLLAHGPTEITQDNTDYLEKLKVGERYIFAVTSNGSTNLVYSFSEFQRVEGSVEETLKTEECADLRKLIDMINADIHTLDVVYTDDMSAIMRFAQNNMMIQSGRMLTEADNVSESNVCVISNDFAKANNLAVGDKMTLKLGTELFEQYKGIGAVAIYESRYSPATKEAELEIVGIYIDTDGQNAQLNQPHWSYSINTVFVPKSLLPVDESTLTDHVFSPAEVSFTVNARDILNFEKTAPAEFEKLGLKLIFDDDGWPSVVGAFETSKQLALIAIAGLSVAMIAATGFIVFLFIVRKKREYAIMRALGTPRKASAKALTLPLMVLSAAAVLTGSGAAWIYTVSTVAYNNAFSSIKNYTVDASLPPWAMIGCIVGQLLLVLSFAEIGLKRAALIPPLRLLQENQTGGKRMKKIRRVPKDKYIESQAKTVDITAIPVFDELPKPTKKNGGHVLRYITRHMRRSIGKSLLSLLLPALLLGAFGQFTLSQRAQVELGNNTVVEAKLVGSLLLSYVDKFRKDDSVTNIYYEYEKAAGFDESSGTLIMTSDITRFTNKQPEITFIEGYDISCMENLNPICIVGSGFLRKYGLHLGDQLHITAESTLGDVKGLYIIRYRAKNPNDRRTDEEILNEHKGFIQLTFAAKGDYFTIVGEVTSSLGDYNEAVFTPGTKDSQRIFGSDIPAGLLEFNLTDPLHAHEFGNYIEDIFQLRTWEIGRSNLAFVMDTSKIDHILNTIALMKKLYPAVVAAGVLIGSFICGLIVIQSSKEAAILRVLGTTRKRTGAMLALEQLLLCIFGLLIGTGGLLIYKGAVLAGIAGKLGFFTGLYFAGCLLCAAVCSAIATRRNVLELLQTKE